MFPAFPFHSQNPFAGIRHLHCFRAALKAGFEVTVSTRALIILEPMEISLAQKGTPSGAF